MNRREALRCVDALRAKLVTNTRLPANLGDAHLLRVSIQAGKNYWRPELKAAETAVAVAHGGGLDPRSGPTANGQQFGHRAGRSFQAPDHRDDVGRHLRC